jgi:hypothetical protein
MNATQEPVIWFVTPVSMIQTDASRPASGFPSYMKTFSSQISSAANTMPSWDPIAVASPIDSATTASLPDTPTGP